MQPGQHNGALATRYHAPNTMQDAQRQPEAPQRSQRRARAAPPAARVALPFASISTSGAPSLSFPWAWPVQQQQQQQQNQKQQQQQQQQQAHQSRQPAAAATAGSAGQRSHQYHAASCPHRRAEAAAGQQPVNGRGANPARPGFWPGPLAGGPSASASSAAVAVVEHQHGLRMLSRHINSEAAKVAGVVGAQLLVHFGNLQRGLAAHGETLTARLPWAGGGGGLQLPWVWHRGGGAGGAAAAGHGAAAARAAFEPAEAARRWLAQGIAAERALDLREALSCYQSAVALEPTSLEYLVRLAKQWSDLTYEPGATAAAIVAANERGVEYAERAIALYPKVGG
jgi:hypothetical protein